MNRRESLSLLAGGLMSFVLNPIVGLSKEIKNNSNRLLRPPGAQAEDIFLAACLRCGKCAQVCTHKAIKIAHGEKGVSLGTPYIVPREAPCHLCLDCSKACPSGALQEVKDKKDVRMGTADYDRDTCLSWQGDECKICYASCPLYGEAIKLEGYARTVIDPNVCAGCGICEYVCVNNPPSVKVTAKE